MPESIFERVVEICCEQLGVDPGEVNLESRFIEDLGADSLDRAELVMLAEEEFDICISDEEAELCLTVGAAVELVESLL